MTVHDILADYHTTIRAMHARMRANSAGAAGDPEGPPKSSYGWSSATIRRSMSAQVYDADSGKAVGGTLTIKAKGHNYQVLKAYLDGSAAYPAAGSNSTLIRIARVLPSEAI